MGDIEVHRQDVSRRETDWKGDSLRDVGSGGAVKELELDRGNGFCREVMILNIFRINKAVARTRVH